SSFRHRAFVRAYHSAAYHCPLVVQSKRSPHRFFLPDFTGLILSPHRLHRESLSRLSAWLGLRCAQRTMVVGRGARRVFLDDPREWNRFAADIGGRSWTPMVHRQTLAMAVALGRARAGRVRRLFVSELAHLRRPARISKNAQGTFSHVVLLAVDWNYRCIPQSPAQSQ